MVLKKVVLIWPSNNETWRNNCKDIRKVFAKLIKEISKEVPVDVLKNEKDIIEYKFRKNVNILNIESDDSWARDVMPFKSEEKYFGFTFDGYNGLLDKFDNDNLICEKYCKLYGYQFSRLPIVVEGGALVCNETDCILTKEWFFDRNPNMELKKAETIFRKMGLKKFLWLEKGVYLDETRGHADNVVAFKNKNEVLLSWTDDESNPNYDICRDNYNKIEAFYKNKKQNIIIHKIQTPKPVQRRDDEEIVGTIRTKENLCAMSYINYLDLGKVILLPQFGVKEDKEVYKKFKDIFKDHKIKKIAAREIILGGGGIHCVTREY